MTQVQKHREYLAYNDRLMLVHEGQLRNEIEDSLRAELTAKSFEKAVKRIPSINLLVRIIDKLSRVYSEPVLRDSEKDSDDKLLTYFEDALELDKKMASANRMLNLHRSVVLEPFVHQRKPKLRIVPAHQFLMYSDDPVDPTFPTVYIKFMYKENKATPFTDRNGRKFEQDETREVDIIYLYSDTEFLVIDSEGEQRLDKMEKLGADGKPHDGTNPVGVLPVVYVNRSEFRLVPVPDTDTLENTILIPKLLADLNYAVQFQSHSVTVALDVDVPDEAVASPDAIWNLKSDGEGGKQGRVETIRPTVDIEQVLMLVQTTLAIWLESRNIKAGTFTQIQAANAASGIAKAIDEADASQDRKAQCSIFHTAEEQLWTLLSKLQKYWSDTKAIDEMATFNDDFKVSIRFSDLKPITSFKDKVEEVKLAIESGMMTPAHGIRHLFGYMTDEDVEKWVEEIAAWKKENENKEQPPGTDSKDAQGSDGPGNNGGSGKADSGQDSGADAGRERSQNTDNGQRVSTETTK